MEVAVFLVVLVDEAGFGLTGAGFALLDFGWFDLVGLFTVFVVACPGALTAEICTLDEPPLLKLLAGGADSRNF